jgi:hypothetical protein
MKAWHDRLQQGEIRIRSGDEKLRPADLPPAEEKEKAAPAEKDTGMGPPG